jgi:type IV pilus assembly protein PilN
MIKINLLRAERQVAWTRVTLEASQRVTVACCLVLVLAGGAVGWRFWAIRGESARLDAELAQAQQEASRLHAIIAEVQQFEQRKAQLQQRVTLIEQLRKNQTGPVRLLDEISRALPPAVWLTSIRQSPDGAEITIEGRCTALTGLSDLIATLESSAYFKRSVDIVSTRSETSPEGGEVIAFGIKATFQPAGDPSEAPPPSGPSPAGT